MVVVGAEPGGLASVEPIPLSFKARDMFNKMNEGAKFPITETKFGRDMKKYGAALVKEKRGDGCIYYQFETKKMREVLVSKHWWAEL